jgi:type III restriction enzyme
MPDKIDKLIINSPFEEPKEYWNYERETKIFTKTAGRRSAGYIVASETSKSLDDPGRFVEIPLVNKIRPRVKAWRESGYAGATGITQRLLEHWNNPVERGDKRFFFCQMEAIETLIWLTEGSDKTGIDIPSDGGNFTRLCAKMATGSGKTVVMAMLCAWQIINKVTYPTRTEFSKNIFVVAPGLTVKNRLQVLVPGSQGNYYDEFNIVPSGLTDKLRLGKVKVRNWHVLNWETDERLAKKKGVDKRGAMSDEAYVREVLDDMASARNIAVINDEAHHAWRVPAESKTKGVKKEDIDQATKWVGGLDRIHAARDILSCYDFSATPFAPSGKQVEDEALFGWIVSDFGLNDAIESGLVKTPRIVVRDDARLTKEYKSRFYHLYNDPEVKPGLNVRAKEEDPLPDLVNTAYFILGKDWLETLKLWEKSGQKVPPVMITVANRMETAARVKYAFDHKQIRIDELYAPEKTIHIDSKVLEMAESQDEETPPEDVVEPEDNENEPEVKLSKKEQALRLREIVNTVGQDGKLGAQIQNVISVGMLSEGWDAKTVTHIMGLRAFSSQLLCEQVVGRGLRRTSYDINKVTGLFEAEYVNVFGVPFSFLPHEEHDGPPPAPPSPKNRVEPVTAKKQYEISWPNIIRIEHTYRPILSLEMAQVKPLVLNAYDTPTLVEIAPVIEGKPDFTRITQIDLEELGRKYRAQRMVFEAAASVYAQMKQTWPGNKEMLLAQVIKLVDEFISARKIIVNPPLFNQDEIRQRIITILNMGKVVHHIWEAIRLENTETITPVFDSDHPLRSTGDMATWYTGRPCQPVNHSHINLCVFDSTWEASEAFELERNANVDAWVKNDHLGFEIVYIYRGVVLKYRPDFIIRLKNGAHLVLEVKGQDTEQDRTKREFLDEWVKAVNAHGGFGKWAWAVSLYPADVKEILEKVAAE